MGLTWFQLQNLIIIYSYKWLWYLPCKKPPQFWKENVIVKAVSCWWSKSRHLKDFQPDLKRDWDVTMTDVWLSFVLNYWKLDMDLPQNTEIYSPAQLIGSKHLFASLVDCVTPNPVLRPDAKLHPQQTLMMVFFMKHEWDTRFTVAVLAFQSRTASGFQWINWAAWSRKTDSLQQKEWVHESNVSEATQRDVLWRMVSRLDEDNGTWVSGTDQTVQPGAS